MFKRVSLTGQSRRTPGVKIISFALRFCTKSTDTPQAKECGRKLIDFPMIFGQRGWLAALDKDQSSKGKNIEVLFNFPKKDSFTSAFMNFIYLMRSRLTRYPRVR